MPRPTGSQFITLYRGLHGVVPADVSTNNVGPHWTRNSRIAERFAMGESAYGGYAHDPDENDEIHGVVLTAKVHPRNIMSNDSEEALNMDVIGDSEEESFLRHRAPVHIERMHHITRWQPNEDYIEEEIKEVPMPKRIHGRV